MKIHVPKEYTNSAKKVFDRVNKYKILYCLERIDFFFFKKYIVYTRLTTFVK